MSGGGYVVRDGNGRILARGRREVAALLEARARARQVVRARQVLAQGGRREGRGTR